MIVKITGKVAPENEEDMNQALDDGNWRDVMGYMNPISVEVEDETTK